MNVLRVLFGARETQRKPKHSLVILADQRVEGSARAGLGLADQQGFGGAGGLVGNHAMHAAPARDVARGRSSG